MSKIAPKKRGPRGGAMPKASEAKRGAERSAEPGPPSRLAKRSEWSRTATDSGAGASGQQASACAAGGAVAGVSGGAVDVATAEAAKFPAALLADLPRGFALRLRALPLAPGGAECEFVVVTSKARYAAARAEGIPAFTGAEWRAMESAAEQGRALRSDLWEWIDAKRKSGSWTLTPERAFDAAFGHLPSISRRPQGWTVREVCERLRVEIVALEMGA